MMLCDSLARMNLTGTCTIDECDIEEIRMISDDPSTQGFSQIADPAMAARLSELLEREVAVNPTAATLDKGETGFYVEWKDTAKTEIAVFSVWRKDSNE